MPAQTLRQAIKAAIRHGGNAGGEFRFADRPQRFRPGCSVHGAAFSEDGGDDIVAGVQILKKFVEAIAPGRRVEEMMVRIDDWIVRINNWLYPAREPVAANRRKWVRRLCLACSFGHGAQEPPSLSVRLRGVPLAQGYHGCQNDGAEDDASHGGGKQDP